MKKWMKYLMSTIIFCILYTIITYLLTKNISFKMIAITTIIYVIIYTATDLICNKLLSKKQFIH